MSNTEHVIESMAKLLILVAMQLEEDPESPWILHEARLDLEQDLEVWRSRGRI